MRAGKLRLYPQEGTLEGFGREGRLKVYESSRTDLSGLPLMTVHCTGEGIRLTKGQVDELIEYLSEWRAAQHD